MIALLFLPHIRGQTNELQGTETALGWHEQPIAAAKAAATSGDKSAQVELGMRYERGRGVARDLDQAARWYRRAAKTTFKRNYVYSGPVGSKDNGHAIEVGRPEIKIGLPDAKLRLDALHHARAEKSK